jgi:hypothetical protein
MNLDNLHIYYLPGTLCSSRPHLEQQYGLDSSKAQSPGRWGGPVSEQNDNNESIPRQYEIRRMLVCQCHNRQRSQYQHQTLSPKDGKSKNRSFKKPSRSDANDSVFNAGAT